jgi:tellurite resistance protein TerC
VPETKELLEWSIFTVVILAMLSVDLFVLNRRSHVIAVKEALLWSAMWIAVALIFGLGVFLTLGKQKGVEYLTGYVIEKSLSVDNLFVFLVIFQYFVVPDRLRPKALTWGIMGALVMRLVFILAGAALLTRFSWMVFIFGGLLIITAIRLATSGEQEVNPERNLVLRIFRRFMNITPDYHDDRFFSRLNGKLMATPFFVVLLVIASTDLVFAVDSIPAIFAITRDPFIVYSSNAFAILGMRALFFAIAGIIGYFIYLRQGLVVILGFVGVKMIASEWYHLPTFVSLGVVAAVLGVTVVLSLLAKKAREKEEEEALVGSREEETGHG